MYAGEGESRIPDENSSPSFDDSTGSQVSLQSNRDTRAQLLCLKGHEFMQVNTNLNIQLNFTFQTFSWFLDYLSYARLVW